MLVLKQITKNYTAGGTSVRALKGIDLCFSRHEFVSILGPSGCGKTTLLNIIGGLDRYTEGDLLINGRSTSEFSDADWDTYRNHSIGFVFQSYNLIPHQSVLSNVELALTLSGVAKAKRRARAIEALKRVGLGDQLNKKPNQLSGGQMQRVAIARALVNNPEILLADEPTGALDSETSLQIMELLKEIARDRLVIMVTHNPELAERYSTRIIHLLDGRVTSDSMPAKVDAQLSESRPKKGKASMHFRTALLLSFQNLLTKKGRTLLTSFAGSIGIIGIALILALSGGARSYIARVEEDTLSNYPITIEQTTTDLSGMMSSFLDSSSSSAPSPDGEITANTMMQDMLSAMSAQRRENDLAAFKEFLDSGGNGIFDYLSDIQYSYDTPLNIYRMDAPQGIVQVNPSRVFAELGMDGVTQMSDFSPMSEIDAWSRLPDNEQLLATQYDVVAGRLPSAWNEVVIVADEDGRISDYTLYALGFLDVSDLKQMLEDIRRGKEVQTHSAAYSTEELMSASFKLLPNTDFYREVDGVYVDMRNDPAFLAEALESAPTIEVVGVLKVSQDALSSNAAKRGFVGYRSDLMTHLITEINESEIVAAQKASPEIDIFTGKPFADSSAAPEFDLSSLSAEQQAYFAGLSEQERSALLEQIRLQSVSSSSYEQNLITLGVADLDSPSAINLYPVDFEAKEQVTAIIEQYNQNMEDTQNADRCIQYTDYIGLMMSSITTIINAISYILITFVAISLVVSSIMIGIITYISVLERTKEIGILRSIGASKRDVSRVFNAETLIIGFSAGVLGIGVTLLLVMAANSIIYRLTGISGLASLPLLGAIVLVLISMFLTLIAGLIPARLAAKKDPVVALRTE